MLKEREEKTEMQRPNRGPVIFDLKASRQTLREKMLEDLNLPDELEIDKTSKSVVVVTKNYMVKV